MWFNFCKLRLFLARLTPTRLRTFNEHEDEEAAMVATWLAVNPALFSDNILRFFNCFKIAVQQQISIFWQSLKIKVSRGKDSVNRKLRGDIGGLLESKYLRCLENPRLFPNSVSSFLSEVLMSIYFMDKYLNPLECDMMLINCSSFKYLMCRSSRRRQLHRMFLLFTMCLHLLETSHNILSISLRQKILNTSTITSSRKAVCKTKLLLVNLTRNSAYFLHHLNKYSFLILVHWVRKITLLFR